ncbi:MAG: hypothetical protein LBT66_03250 [Methanobrevibacter sp.]|jgi:hypothetical protein|nr:hypothetical protein [Candidatus Methanovirga meridionalis]
MKNDGNELKKMIIFTNITDLNKNTVNESLNMLNQHNLDKSNEIKEIIYLKEEPIEFNGDLKDISINSNIIPINNDMDEIYNKITTIVKNLVDRKEFMDVIVDTSFLGYLLLEVLIKKFDITDVFLIENEKLKKAHPCSCGSDYMGY